MSKKVVSAELIGEYPSHGYTGTVVVLQHFQDGTDFQMEIEGEHSSSDIMNYQTPEYWNE